MENSDIRSTIASVVVYHAIASRISLVTNAFVNPESSFNDKQRGRFIKFQGGNALIGFVNMIGTPGMCFR